MLLQAVHVWRLSTSAEAKKLLDYALKHDGKVPRSYHYKTIRPSGPSSSGDPPAVSYQGGRRYVEGLDCSLQGGTRACRKAAAAHLYDVDINNCHPRILHQLVRQISDIECESLQSYLDNREKHLEEVTHAFQCSRKQARELYLRIMNGGSTQTWMEENDLPTRSSH